MSEEQSPAAAERVPQRSFFRPKAAFWAAMMIGAALRIYCVVFTSGTGSNGQYQVASVPDPTHFTFWVTNSLRQTQNSMTVYPLVAPPIVRSGNVADQTSTWHMSSTDGSLTQSPLNSPTATADGPMFSFPQRRLFGQVKAQMTLALPVTI